MITSQPVQILGQPVMFQDTEPVAKPFWGMFAISMVVYVGIAGALVYVGTRKRKRR